MNIDLNLAAGAISALGALQSAIHARRSTKLAEAALKATSYKNVETLPSAESMGVTEVNGKFRAKIIVFNQSETPFRIHCVKSYVYSPKKRNLSNWLHRNDEDFDWDFAREHTNWNPKGTLDDDEQFAEAALPFTLVRDTETLLVTIQAYATNRHQLYKFVIVTSQGVTSLTTTLNNGNRLPFDHQREIY
ncbi:hypothetical protein ACW9YV_11355 [Paraburkholderia strydomiana]